MIRTKNNNPKTVYYLSKFKGIDETEIFKSGIYQISFVGSNKTYIGSTSKINSICWKSGFYNRWKQHLLDLQKNKHPNPKVQHMYNKYGEDAIEACEYTGVSYGTLFRQLKGKSTKLKDMYDVRRVATPIPIYKQFLSHPDYAKYFDINSN